ncbi:MAG: hypothetical protein KC635_15480 [Myxococcales bacterium]|nr:hypothetical protein [Myxococcales bacterium]MCB9733121.1 hypothetical protein [Deltaproteobacteria bacterium]
MTYNDLYDAWRPVSMERAEMTRRSASPARGARRKKPTEAWVAYRRETAETIGDQRRPED